MGLGLHRNMWLKLTRLQLRPLQVLGWRWRLCHLRWRLAWRPLRGLHLLRQLHVLRWLHGLSLVEHQLIEDAALLVFG